jgi:hypothetical protein
MAHRLRVIYADLSEFVGTTAEWDRVHDGILIIQIEQRPGEWVTVHGHDWYYVLDDHAAGYADDANWDLTTGSSTMIPLRPNGHERAGKLVDREVWQRAKALMRELPDALR